MFRRVVHIKTLYAASSYHLKGLKQTKVTIQLLAIVGGHWYHRIPPPTPRNLGDKLKYLEIFPMEWVITCMQFTFDQASYKVSEPRLLVQEQMSHLMTKPTMGICPVWSESSLSAWRNIGSLATQSAHSEDSDQDGWSESSLGTEVILFVLCHEAAQMAASCTDRKLQIYCSLWKTELR